MASTSISESLIEWANDLGYQLPHGTRAPGPPLTPEDAEQLCKSQMAPIWKFLCSRVTTKDKAKALRSQMEESRNLPTKTTDESKRLQHLESQRAALEKQLRNAKTVLGGLEERVQASILKAGRLELENQRKKSKKMELIERNRLMDLARTERANRTRLLEHCLADMNDVNSNSATDLDRIFAQMQSVRIATKDPVSEKAVGDPRESIFTDMMISNIQETRETKVRELENEARERELDLLMEVIHVKYSELGPTFVENLTAKAEFLSLEAALDLGRSRKDELLKTLHDLQVKRNKCEKNYHERIIKVKMERDVILDSMKQLLANLSYNRNFSSSTGYFVTPYAKLTIEEIPPAMETLRGFVADECSAIARSQLHDIQKLFNKDDVEKNPESDQDAHNLLIELNESLGLPAFVGNELLLEYLNQLKDKATTSRDSIEKIQLTAQVLSRIEDVIMAEYGSESVRDVVSKMNDANMVKLDEARTIQKNLVEKTQTLDRLESEICQLQLDRNWFENRFE